MSIPLSGGRLREVAGGDVSFRQPLRLQLIEAKALGRGSDRFQGIISDGVYSAPVLLTGVASAKLIDSTSKDPTQPGAILEATEYKPSSIEAKRVFVIFDCRVIGHSGLIGKPTPLDMNHPQNQQPRRPVQPRYFPAEPERGAPSAARSLGDSFGRAFQTQTGTTRPLPQPQTSVNYGVSRPVVAEDHITPLAQLNNYSARWTILARCTSKSVLRKFHNSRGEGRLFSFDLLDADEGEIRCSVFNEAAVMFFEKIEVGRIYRISKADVFEIRDPKYKTFETNFEMRLNMSSSVECVPEEASLYPIPYILYHFKPIESISRMERGAQLDVIGIVVHVEPSRRINKKNGDEVDQRRLTIKDTSNCSIEVTLWDDLAVTEGQELEELMRDDNLHIVAISHGTSRIELDPDLPEATVLVDWVSQGNASTPVTSLTQVGPMKLSKRSCLSDISIQTVVEKPSFFEVCGTISYIRTNRLCYPACPLQRNGRSCMKKVSEQNPNEWMCEMCGEMVEPEWRYTLDMKLNDYTDAKFATAFASAEEILGLSAKELRERELADPAEAEAIVRRALYQTRIFTVKAYLDNWQGDAKLKIAVLRQEPLDYVAETKRLMKEIEEQPQVPVRQEPRPQHPPVDQARGYYIPQTPLDQRFGAHGFPA